MQGSSSRVRTPHAAALRAMEQRADASTLCCTAFNVGMNNPTSFATSQDEKLQTLAGHVKKWLDQPGPAVVGLNELAPNLAQKLVRDKLAKLPIGTATNETNCVLWRTILNTSLLVLLARPGSCWCRLLCLSALPACLAWC